MSRLNRVILAGVITNDIELRHTPSGAAVSDIGLAVTDGVKRGTGAQDETMVFEVTLWGQTAEVAAEQLGKGSSILIEGRLKLVSSETGGQRRQRLKIVADCMEILGNRTPSQDDRRRNKPLNALIPQNTPATSSPPDDELRL